MATSLIALAPGRVAAQARSAQDGPSGASLSAPVAAEEALTLNSAALAGLSAGASGEERAGLLVQRAAILLQLNRPQEALDFARQGYAALAPGGRATSAAGLEAGGLLATLLVVLGRSHEALPIQQQVADGLAALSGADSRAALTAASNALTALSTQAKLDVSQAGGVGSLAEAGIARLEAVVNARRILLARTQASLGPSDALTLIGVNNLADDLRALNRPEEALPLLLPALGIAENADPLSPITLTLMAGAMATHGSLYHLGEADRLFELLSNRLAAGGDDGRAVTPTPLLASALASHGLGLVHEGHASAIPAVRRALGVQLMLYCPGGATGARDCDGHHFLTSLTHLYATRAIGPGVGRQGPQPRAAFRVLTHATIWLQRRTTASYLTDRDSQAEFGAQRGVFNDQIAAAWRAGE